MNKNYIDIHKNTKKTKNSWKFIKNNKMQINKTIFAYKNTKINAKRKY